MSNIPRRDRTAYGKKNWPLQKFVEYFDVKGFGKMLTSSSVVYFWPFIQSMQMVNLSAVYDD